MSKTEKIKIVCLGCAKNNVDAEVMAGILEENGIEIVDGDAPADTVLINTCSFIDKAKQESIETILNASRLKEKGEIKKIIVTGCLPQRYGGELQKEMPEIDSIAGINDIPRIMDYVSSGRESSARKKDSPTFIYDHKLPRKRFTPHGVSYIKIADGCSNRCSYCSIPAIRGDLRCREIKSIVNEAKKLARDGTVEINLIAQDLTAFGNSDNNGNDLKTLLVELEKIKGIKWIRPLYLYPSKIDNELIDIISSSEKICKYFDIPIQHSEDRILKKMGRKYRRQDIEELMTRIRERAPDAVLRTSLITGFPGESKEDFNSLLEFIKKVRFDTLGTFTYSREIGTPAYSFKGHVSKKEAMQRALEIENAQREISAARNKNLIGTLNEAIVERKSEETGFYEGRIKSQAPDVDGITFIQGKKLVPGKIYKVEIVSSVDFDLTAEVVK
ncbi:MAG: 30S ribosomal protein S12 methylthiotransferase RimO [Candidatus Schekmanbacteria bacterium]|nr:30S ribosomal protein S12 methylthiotransferase RimO [Candidatus Schekmanbacteria bacterium]